jgi:hypothetical protein
MRIGSRRCASRFESPIVRRSPPMTVRAYGAPKLKIRSARASTNTSTRRSTGSAALLVTNQ